MKYLILLLTFSLQIHFAIAQITITSEDIADVGTSLPRIIDNTPNAAIVPGNTGADLIWDFSSITTNEMDTVSFVEVAGTPYANEFPEADVCIRLGLDIDYAYASVNSSGIELFGASQYIDELEDDVVVHFSPTQTNMQFPATYGTTFNDSYGFTVVRYYGQTVTLPGVPFPVMVDSVKIINTTEATNTFDAWGELVTPYGDFRTIRNRRVDYIENELFAKSNSLGFWIDVSSWMGDAAQDTVSIYSWWANNIGYPIFEIETDYQTNAVEKATCLEIGDIAVKEKAINKINTKVYPIPANDIITIESNFQGSAFMRIYDLTGSLVVSKSFNKFPYSLNISDLSENLYFYTLLGNNNQEIGQGKFYIVR